MSFSLGSLFHSLGASIANFFGGHHAQIQSALAEAQSLAGAASIVLAAVGQPAAAIEINKISGALTFVGTAVTAESTAETLTQHATNLATLTTELVNSGDIGIKNDVTKATIAAVATKVQNAVGALETAAGAKQ